MTDAIVLQVVEVVFFGLGALFGFGIGVFVSLRLQQKEGERG